MSFGMIYLINLQTKKVKDESPIIRSNISDIRKNC